MRINEYIIYILMLHHHHFKHTRNSNSNTYSGKLGQAQIYSRDERELRTKPKKKNTKRCT